MTEHINDPPFTSSATFQEPVSVESSSPEFWQELRRALLIQVEAIERHINISPRTSEIRREMKERGGNCHGS
jgi:hypothetical protein